MIKLRSEANVISFISEIQSNYELYDDYVIYESEFVRRLRNSLENNESLIDQFMLRNSLTLDHRVCKAVDDMFPVLFPEIEHLFLDRIDAFNTVANIISFSRK